MGVTGLRVRIEHPAVHAQAPAWLADSRLRIQRHLHIGARQQVHLTVSIAGDVATGNQVESACTIGAGHLQLAQRHVSPCQCIQRIHRLHAGTRPHRQAVRTGSDVITDDGSSSAQLQ